MPMHVGDITVPMHLYTEGHELYLGDICLFDVSESNEDDRAFALSLAFLDACILLDKVCDLTNVFTGMNDDGTQYLKADAKLRYTLCPTVTEGGER